MKLELREKTLYGRICYYPVNDTAIKMAQFIKQKTFTPTQVMDLKSVGFEIQVILDKPKYLGGGS